MVWTAGVRFPAVSLEIELPGREEDYCPPSSNEHKNVMDQYLHSATRLHDVLLN
jgi:hypothetical protein